jgi:hypothetical protein
VSGAPRAKQRSVCCPKTRLSIELRTIDVCSHPSANPVFLQALMASGGRIVPVPGGVLIRDGAGDIIGSIAQLGFHPTLPAGG